MHRARARGTNVGHEVHERTAMIHGNERRELLWKPRNYALVSAVYGAARALLAMRKVEWEIAACAREWLRIREFFFVDGCKL